MVRTRDSGADDERRPDNLPDGHGAGFHLAHLVLGGWGPALRAALLLGILVLGLIAVAAISPWAALPALGAAGGWLIGAGRRARRR